MEGTSGRARVPSGFPELLGCTHGTSAASEQGRRVSTSTPPLPSLPQAENLLVASRAAKRTGDYLSASAF